MTSLEMMEDPSESHSDDASSGQKCWNSIGPELGILLSTTLPSLESIVNDSASSGQTILTSAAADACFELIEISSRFAVYLHRLQVPALPGSQKAEEIACLMNIWKDVLPIIDRLLTVKQRWSVSNDDAYQLESNSCAPRVNCSTAVVNDWFDVIKSSKRLYFDYLMKDGLREGYDYSAALSLFVNLSGILLRSAEKAGDLSGDAFIRVGGIAQTLCQYKECIVGAIVSPLYDSDSVVVSVLQESSRWTDSIRNARKNMTVAAAFTKINHQRAAVRAFTSWISSSNKAIRFLTKSMKNPYAPVDLLDSSMGSLVLMLRSESKQCVDMSIASL